MKNKLTEDILGIIPARGGSTEILRKNLVDIGGKPLISYTIEAAKKSKTLSRIICSTDCHDIMDVALQHGAEIPFLRPPELALSETPMISVLQHAIAFLEKDGYKPDIVVLLQPTSPLRNAGHIDEAVRLLLETGCESVVSLCKAEHNPHWMRVIRNGRVQYFIERNGADYSLRQKLPEVYRLNGAVYASRYPVIMHQGKILGDDTRPLIMKQEDSIDIDTEWDLEIARFIVQRKMEHSN